MTLFDLCHWLYTLPVSTSIRESDWTFSIVETVHVLALAVMVGSVAVVDLRLLGLVFRRQPASQVLAQLLPITWTGFAVMAVSGAVLFVSEAEKLYGSWPFRAKLVLLLVAGLNPLIFHQGVYRGVQDWDLAPVPPAQVRLAAVLSLVLWSGIVVLGRMVAYFH
jgi:hypothetical protein